MTKARDGMPLRLVVNTKRLHFFDPDTGLAIYGQEKTASPQTRMGALAPSD
jgi:hypothetical protein